MVELLDHEIDSQLADSVKIISKALQRWAEFEPRLVYRHPLLAYATYYDLALAAQKLISIQTLDCELSLQDSVRT